MRGSLLAVCALLQTVAADRLAAQHVMSVQHNRGLAVSSDWLAARLDSGLVIVHVGRSDSLYRVAHVPGATFLPLSTVATTVNGVFNEFPPVRNIAAAIVHLRIGDSTRVVVYGDDPGLYAARLWAALDLAGLGARAAILDGGLVRWRAEGRPVDTGLVTVQRPQVLLHGHWQAEKIVDAEWVRAHLGDSTVLFVDARPPDQYAGAEPPCPTGAECHTIPEGRRGHIPGARSLYWLNALVSREDPVLRPMPDLHHGLWMAAGADEPRVRTIVVYCRTGMQASFDYFLARYVGYPDVRLYDGSMTEWASLPAETHPVEAGAPASPPTQR